MEDIIVGTCLEMCPAEERSHREREGLLHRLELSPENFVSHKSVRQRPPADPSKTIKSFSRSAAGQVTSNPKNLRPAHVLLKTVRYLVENIIPNWESRPLDTYDFINDRFRAIRQDMTIQRLPPEDCLPFLQPMIKFYVLFGYLLGSNERFELHLNEKHANECILTALDCYKCVSDDCLVSKNEIETLYCCLMMNSPGAVVEIAKSAVLELLVSWTTNNYWRCFRLMEKLDVLPRAALARHVCALRARALASLCVSMSSPNSAYQADRLAWLLSYNSIEELFEDCALMGIRVADSKCHFRKSDLKSNVSVKKTVPKWHLVDELLPENFTKILLS